jgi:hypothetical protein
MKKNNWTINANWDMNNLEHFIQDISIPLKWTYNETKKSDTEDDEK